MRTTTSDGMTIVDSAGYPVTKREYSPQFDGSPCQSPTLSPLPRSTSNNVAAGSPASDLLADAQKGREKAHDAVALSSLKQAEISFTSCDDADVWFRPVVHDDDDEEDAAAAGHQGAANRSEINADKSVRSLSVESAKVSQQGQQQQSATSVKNQPTIFDIDDSHRLRYQDVEDETQSNESGENERGMFCNSQPCTSLKRKKKTQASKECDRRFVPHQLLTVVDRLA